MWHKSRGIQPLIVLILAALLAPSAGADEGKEKERQGRFSTFARELEVRRQEVLKKAEKEAAKRAKKAAKLAEKALKEEGKELKEKERLKRLEKQRKEEAKHREKFLEKLFEKGRINPTNMAILESDLLMSAVGNQPAAMQVEAALAHQEATGNGILVAILDSGFNLNHPLLADRIAPFAYDALELDFDPEDRGNGYDDDWDGNADNGLGHGTFVAGMVLLAAPDVSILPVRVADDEGRGTEMEVADGIEFAIAMGADIINLSYEAGTKDHRIKSLLDDARKQGIVVVTSAGNGAQQELGVIAEEDFTISVAAVDGKDRLAEFSNTAGKRQEITVLAPGVEMWGPYGEPYDGAMCVWSGTSFAAGLVTGAAALILERHPEYTAEQVMAALRNAVDVAYDADGMPFAGTGRINLRKVVNQ